MSSKKDLAQMVRRLKQEGLVVGALDHTARGHGTLHLVTGDRYVIAHTPSDWRGLKNVEAGIRRIVNAGKSRTPD